MGNITVKKSLLLLSALLCISGYSHYGLAACTFNPGVSERKLNFTLPGITVQRDTPVGTVLAEQKLPEAGRDVGLGCTGTVTYINGDFRFSTLSAYGNKVYDTNILGIGIRISLYSPGDTIPGHLPISSTLTYPATLLFGGAYRIQLIKTSPNDVGTGTISAGTVSRAYIVSPRTYYNTISINSVRVNKAACTVTKTVIPVPLGNKVSADFSGVGSTTKDEPFTIPLSCTAGTKVNVTLDGNPHPSGAPGVLELSPVSSGTAATGVGVQVLYRSAPVTFGKIINIGTASSGTYNIPMTGRYYQTAANITGGEANATATFTMTYR